LVDDVISQEHFEAAVNAVVAATRTEAIDSAPRSVLVVCRRGRHRSPVVGAVAREVLMQRGVEVHIVELALCKYFLIGQMFANLFLWFNGMFDQEIVCANSYGCFMMEDLCETKRAQANLAECFRKNAKIPRLSNVPRPPASVPPAHLTSEASSSSATTSSAIVQKAAPIGGRRSPATVPLAAPPPAAMPPAAMSPAAPIGGRASQGLSAPPTAASQAALLGSLKNQLAISQQQPKGVVPPTGKAPPTLKSTSKAPPAGNVPPRVVPPQPKLAAPQAVADPGHSSSSSSAAESSSRPAPTSLTSYDYWVCTAFALDKEAHIYKQWDVFNTLC
jgi:hypothetical protein